MLSNLGGHPILGRILNSSSRLTRSNALVRSNKAMWHVLFTTFVRWRRSCMSMVDRPVMLNSLPSDLVCRYVGGGLGQCEQGSFM